MTRLEIKHLMNRYRPCLPSVIIRYDGKQYYCSNWLSIVHVIRMLGFTHTNQVEHIKFSLLEWGGTKDQLMYLLDYCEKAKELQDSKFDAKGWYLIWSDIGIEYNTHM